MNRRMVFYVLGQMFKVVAGLMTLPFIVSLIYKEECMWSFLISIAIALVVGVLLSVICKTSNSVIYAKEGFVIVALSWIAMSAVGALPFFISGEIPSYVDAFFETVSGFTTTGASILTDVEAMSKGLLFWRSFTHWVGGMGVLVFIMAIIPKMSDRSIHILRAEMPGPIVGKLVPKARDTAKILYLIYIVMTIIQFVMLLFGGMSVFESIVHAFGTAGTGGFGIMSDSISGYSAYIQWVITVFMFLFGINFNLYYLLIFRKPKIALKSEELWVYVGISVAAVVAITVNTFPMYDSVGESVRHSAFQVASLMSTTGFSTTDFNLWPGFSKSILLFVMFTGACAGSTAGGFKLSRVVILVKMIKCEIKKLIHPRAVVSVRFEGKKVDSPVLSGVGTYLALYAVCFISLFLVLSIEKFDLETNLTAAVACFNNVGPGFGGVGPASSFAAYSPLSKVMLSLAMLFGRLEIYPLLFTLSPSTWTKKVRKAK